MVIEDDADGDMGGLIGEHDHMELVQVQQYGSEYWFILREMSTTELERLKDRGDIDYIAMMMGVEL